MHTIVSHQPFTTGISAVANLSFPVRKEKLEFYQELGEQIYFTDGWAFGKLNLH